MEQYEKADEFVKVVEAYLESIGKGTNDGTTGTT